MTPRLQYAYWILSDLHIAEALIDEESTSETVTFAALFSALTTSSPSDSFMALRLLSSSSHTAQRSQCGFLTYQTRAFGGKSRWATCSDEHVRFDAVCTTFEVLPAR